MGAGASPPCKFYSTARRREDEASQPPLIDATRDTLGALFEFWWMENVLGARRHMSRRATELDGALLKKGARPRVDHRMVGCLVSVGCG